MEGTPDVALITSTSQCYWSSIPMYPLELATRINHLTLTLTPIIYQIGDPKDACVAFSNDPRSDNWKCLKDLSTEKEQRYIKVRSKTDHFTSVTFQLRSSIVLPFLADFLSLALTGRLQCY